MHKKKLITKSLAFALACFVTVTTLSIPTSAAQSVSPSTSGATSTMADTGTTTTYKYVYAALSWKEYWESEGVYDAGDTTASTDTDSKGETDLGAFDVVTRATTNHGLHRGSFQCTTTIYDENDTAYGLVSWSTNNVATLSDGSTFSKGVITKSDGSTTTLKYYEVSGIKYVPVAVSEADYADFCKSYTVVENDGTLSGGYSEQELNAYTVTAAVTAHTNGLKTATKNSDGTFSFSSRQTGSDSGLAATTLKTANSSEDTEITATVKPASGSYGEFLRVDLNGNGYGDLGSNMYAVKWTYYGNDSTRTTALASYGTKFAADNWMHKTMGIQLGLTDSLRCQLPDGYNGTGYWDLTVYAMGYKDYTVSFQATTENIVNATAEETISTADLESAIAAAEKLKESDYTAATWANLALELAEAKDELSAKHSQAAVTEAKEHLLNAIAALEKATQTTPEKHSYGSTYVYQKATFTTAGKLAQKCSICNDVKITGTIAKVSTVTLNKTSFTYNGKVQKPSITLKDSNGKTISTKYYSVSYASGSKKPGRYAVKVTLKGNYSGSKTLYYTIAPKKTTASLTKATKSTLTVKWAKATGVSGYQIQYSTSSKFTKAKTVSVSAKKTSSKLTKLSKNKKYYVRVRSYKTITVNKKSSRLYASWSTVKTGKTTKK